MLVHVGSGSDFVSWSLRYAMYFRFLWLTSCLPVIGQATLMARILNIRKVTHQGQRAAANTRTLSGGSTRVAAGEIAVLSTIALAFC